jgi:hypothetical protein
MIDFETLLGEIKESVAAICPDGCDVADLVRMAERAVAENIRVISADPKSVESLWTWLEKRPVDILARFFLENQKHKNPDSDQSMSQLSEQINKAFKKGAAGAQVFVPFDRLDSFVNELRPIRDGLFFNKSLSVCLDINAIGSADWMCLFGKLDEVKADALLLYLSETRKKNADFVGRIYAFLENFDPGFNTELHFMLDRDIEKTEQVWRLVNKLRPKVADRLRFFVSN